MVLTLLAPSSLNRLAKIAVVIASLEATVILIDDPAGDHQVWCLDVDPRQRLGVLIPLDSDFRVRLDAVRREQRLLVGLPAGPLPRGWRLTPMQRRRYLLMLRALDGHLAGASYREIARLLLDAEAARWPASVWKSSAARSQIIRLVTEGTAHERWLSEAAARALSPRPDC